MRHIVVARELTKYFESFVSGRIDEVIQHFTIHSDEIRGEIVILVEGVAALPQSEQDSAFIKKTLYTLMDELPLKQAVTLASNITGERKNRLYEMALSRQAPLED